MAIADTANCIGTGGVQHVSSQSWLCYKAVAGTNRIAVSTDPGHLVKGLSVATATIF